MLHSLILARDGGFLVHAASAVRNGRAFLFAGVSGAGKTTIWRLAPPDVALLQNILFFAQDDELQQLVFHTAFEFVSCVTVRRLVFAPEVRVWDLIRQNKDCNGQRDWCKMSEVGWVESQISFFGARVYESTLYCQKQ